MEFLYFLEGLRTPLGDAFFSAITHLGEETLFIVVGLVFFWCIDKLEGYYLLTVGLTGTVVNQFLKLWFRIPRPWVLDEGFSIVESARAEATGYSFPSGHTQASVGIFGALARWNKNKAVRVVCLLLCVLVPLSRLYLGVHTPLDVGVSALLAAAMVLGFYPPVRRAAQQPGILQVLLAGMTVLAACFLAFVCFYPFPADVDPANLASGTKTAWTMMGCTLGVWLAFVCDQRWLHFDTKAVWWAQLIKLAVGLVLALGIKAGLKAPLYALLNGSYAADGIRYFLLVVFAGCLWPMTFGWFRTLGRKK